MNLKIGIIIPDRGDRPELLKNCIRMMKNQTIQAETICVVDDPVINPDIPDITYRYRIGYDRLRNKNLDCILLIENDDWYHPKYIERMVEKWIELGKPDLCGHQYTVYYHVAKRAWLKLDHFRRSSAMNTLIKPDLNFGWCVDHEVYTDLHLWMKSGLHGVTWMPLTHLCLGIKHAIGKTGGAFHSTYLNRFKNQDPNFDFLKQYMDFESFDFYTNTGLNIFTEAMDKINHQ
jgi:glycosyltransferase involved in cell wall biosynthesis